MKNNSVIIAAWKALWDSIQEPATQISLLPNSESQETKDTALSLFCSEDGLNVLAIFSEDRVPSSNGERLSCLCPPSAALTMHQGQVQQLCSYCSFWTAGSCVSRATISPPLLVSLHPKAILVVHSLVSPPKLEEGPREYFDTIKSQSYGVSVSVIVCDLFFQLQPSSLQFAGVCLFTPYSLSFPCIWIETLSVLRLTTEAQD